MQVVSLSSGPHSARERLQTIGRSIAERYVDRLILMNDTAGFIQNSKLYQVSRKYHLLSGCWNKTIKYENLSGALLKLLIFNVNFYSIHASHFLYYNGLLENS